MKEREREKGCRDEREKKRTQVPEMEERKRECRFQRWKREEEKKKKARRRKREGFAVFLFVEKGG